MTLISRDINGAIDLLSKDEVVAIPTETVYGLAGNLFSSIAITKIFDIKQRPMFNPLIAHVSSIDRVHSVVNAFPDRAQKLAEAFWPGPLTMVLPKRSHIPDLVTAGKDTVAVRIPNHPLTLQLLETIPFPLCAPSANPFNRISPTRSDHVKAYFEGVIPMILEGGHCAQGIESTIIGFEDEQPILYRLGSISIEEIEGVIGHIEIKNLQSSAPKAPGMLAKHYAPLTKTYLVDDVMKFASKHLGKRIGILRFDENTTAEANHIVTLSASGNLKEAASNLYKSLHELDHLHLDLIIAERLPDYGLGRSINDRLQRATTT